MIACMSVGRWQFWIDRGGTFTDVIGLAPDGRLHLRKVLTSGVHAEDAGIAGVKAILDAAGIRTGALADAGARATAAIESLKVGTTVATNALLERKGEPVVLVTTAGHRDALHIGTQARPDIFAREIRRPAPLYVEAIEARERLDAGGVVLEPLDEESLRSALAQARERDRRAVAIVFLHGWKHVAHEAAAARIARDLRFEQVSVSHEIAPLARFVPRGDTTVLDAYLAPPLEHYVRALQTGLATLDPGARLHFMQSSGGLVTAERFRAAASVLSGPAGGLVAMAKIAPLVGEPRLIGFDMGGTSTDVSLFDGELESRYDQSIAGVRLQAPMLDVHTIAAGGGSVLHAPDGRLAVGPASAGADPGPACYGRGGPPALTDAQVVLGRLQPAFLPSTFGPAANAAIDAEAARRALLALAERGGFEALALETLAESCLDVAVEAMANAIRQVSTGRGLDPARFTLFAFGGASGQCACRVADACGIGRIVLHPLASVMSAFGIGVADWLEVRRASVRRPADGRGLEEAAAVADRLEAEGRSALEAQGFTPRAQTATRWLELRAGAAETSLSVREAALAEVVADFSTQHRARFGYEPALEELIVEAVRVEVRASPAMPEIAQMQEPEHASLPATARAWFGAWIDAPVLRPRALAGRGFAGPALIVTPGSTLVLERGWNARAASGSVLLFERIAAASPMAAGAIDTAPRGARLEIFNNLFMHVAEEMGAVLRQTAQSVNIKERLDYSCALFDAGGGLVANAPHMPVHLGSMGASVRAVMAARGDTLHPGDAVLLNSPYHGGTHLPDMTVVTPVFLAGGKRPDAFVASRAHHADVGGITPGSMPPFSRTIDEEGALFADFPLVAAGRFAEHKLLEALAAGSWPARNPQRNLADLRAQLAANARGIAELERAAARHGLATLLDLMRDVQANAAECVRAAIEKLRPGSFRYEMDDGHVIAVRIDIDRAARSARIDFTGSSPQGAHNFNAPRAVCVAAVLYVFRTLVERPIPLNEGCLAPLEIVIPRGSILDPAPPAAVVAGNVETSQVIVDALYGALRVLAASQGTMNNFTFGDARVQYYETIAGGAGAGRDFDGCDAVQTHMTNSRLTDTEILEAALPILVREFAVRRGSGGAGRRRGGDGIVRRIEFRATLDAAMLANRRRVPPFGLEGGGSGAPGVTRLRRRDGTIVAFEGTARFRVEPGDVLEVLTPGGGGFG
jgi:5-oxoprolinase (ATP-hydrolysing)